MKYFFVLLLFLTIQSLSLSAQSRCDCTDEYAIGTWRLMGDSTGNKNYNAILVTYSDKRTEAFHYTYKKIFDSSQLGLFYMDFITQMNSRGYEFMGNIPLEIDPSEISNSTGYLFRKCGTR